MFKLCPLIQTETARLYNGTPQYVKENLSIVDNLALITKNILMGSSVVDYRHVSLISLFLLRRNARKSVGPFSVLFTNSK